LVNIANRVAFFLGTFPALIGHAIFSLGFFIVLWDFSLKKGQCAERRLQFGMDSRSVPNRRTRNRGSAYRAAPTGLPVGRQTMQTQSHLSDVKTLRERARRHIEQGAVTEAYTGDREEVVRLLNEALATEMVCVLRYKRHYFMARGINAESIAAEFAAHAAEEQMHADQIAERIVQLGGAPDLSPDGLSQKSHAEYVEGTTLVNMLKENLVAERIAIDSYREVVNYIGTSDPTTRRLLEGILAKEEEHAEDLSSLLVSFA